MSEIEPIINEQDIKKVQELIESKTFKNSIKIALNAQIFGQDKDIDKLIINYLSRGTNIKGICYYHIAYYLLNEELLFLNERYIRKRLSQLEKYKLIETIKIKDIGETFYKLT